MELINGSMNFVNNMLQQLFEGHGVQTNLQSGRVTFPAHPELWVNGELFAYNESIVQLDVRLSGFDGERFVVESIAGLGPDLIAQADFAVQAFANGSFHVFMPVFFGQPPCHGTERQVWTIGHPRAVYSGPITTILGYPPLKNEGVPDLGFYPEFIKRLENCTLPRGTHWIRIYQMRENGVVVSNEVLLDNYPWEEMQFFMAEQLWPVADKPYDVRVFLVVKDIE